MYYFYSSVQTLPTVKLSSCKLRIFHGSRQLRQSSVTEVCCVLFPDLWSLSFPGLLQLPLLLCKRPSIQRDRRESHPKNHRLSNERIATSISSAVCRLHLFFPSQLVLVPRRWAFPAFSCHPFLWVRSANPCHSIGGCDWSPYRLAQRADRSRHPCHSVMRKNG